MEAAIEIVDVTKRFRLLHDKQSSLKATILNKGRRTTYEEFLALDDVSFDIPANATFGFIGENGSGKSTMLKCVTRIYKPDKGHIAVHGKMSALLELGAGFHPELSGRENVYLNASILGLSAKDVDARFDDIVGFAGLERFIDTPVKNYSSGMFVRLGFSVAINVEPEILLVDEILAVGDEEFQTRCLEKFADLKRSGCTIVVVSHGLDQMRTLCDQIAWFEHGVLQQVGPAGEVVDAYLRAVRESRKEFEVRVGVRKTAEVDNPIIRSLELLDASGNRAEVIRSGAPCTIRVTFDEGRIGEVVAVAFGLFRTDGAHLASMNTGGVIPDGGLGGPGTTPAGSDLIVAPPVAAGVTHVDYAIPSLVLPQGVYDLSVALHDPDMLHVHERADRALRFDVESDPDFSYPQRGMVALRGTWTHAR